MLFYFMTAGSLPEKDYAWWKFEDQKLERVKAKELPCVANDTYPNFSDWLDGDPTRFSLFLARNKNSFDNHLFLVICNLETGRKDHQRRMIRNSVVLVSSCSNEDQIIRCFAAACLDDDFLNEAARTLDETLKERPDRKDVWLEFDSESWWSFLESNQSVDYFVNDIKKSEGLYIAKDSKKQRELVKYFLLQQANLPEKPILVVLTGFKKSDFYETHSKIICFVLTDIEKSNEWRIINKNTKDRIREVIIDLGRKFKNHSKFFISISAVSIIVFFLLAQPDFFSIKKTLEKNSQSDVSRSTANLATKDQQSAEILKAQAGLPIEDFDPSPQQELKISSQGDDQASSSQLGTEGIKHQTRSAEKGALNTMLSHETALNPAPSIQQEPTINIDYGVNFALYCLFECQLPFYVRPLEFCYGRCTQNCERCPSYGEVLRFTHIFRKLYRYPVGR